MNKLQKMSIRQSFPNHRLMNLFGARYSLPFCGQIGFIQENHTVHLGRRAVVAQTGQKFCTTLGFRRTKILRQYPASRRMNALHNFKGDRTRHIHIHYAVIAAEMSEERHRIIFRAIPSLSEKWIGFIEVVQTEHIIKVLRPEFGRFESQHRCREKHQRDILRNLK